MKLINQHEFYSQLPEHELLMVDILRQIVSESLPDTCREKLSFHVPYFYGNKGICIIWPATIPRGGFREGVLLGFWYGKFLRDTDRYLTHGTNKQIFYKIFKSAEEINEKAIRKLLKEAVELDLTFSKKQPKRKKLHPSPKSGFD